METDKKTHNFQKIKTKREYIDLRLQLKDSFILFFGYKEEDDEWFEFLTELQNKFSEKLKIIIFDTTSEEKLVDVLRDEKESSNSEIEFPRAVLCHPHITEPQLLTDLTPFDLYKVVEEYNKFYKEKFESEKEKVFEKIKKILSSYPVVIFIKGTPHDPFCKFSKSFIEIIKKTGVRYRSFDIFRDESLRSYLRLYSGWKTYPQLYINGKIIGGVDVLKDLVDNNKFMDMIPFECKREGAIHSIEQFLKDNPVVVFGKGTPETAKCKGTIEVYDTLSKHGIKFVPYDVLKDEMIRELLKEVYKYPYYPQIFKNGQLLGGLKYLREVINEDKSGNKLKEILS